MSRALAWTEIISSNVEDPYEEAFAVFRKGGDAAEQREKFIKHATNEKPNRTLEVDTKGILKRGY